MDIFLCLAGLLWAAVGLLVLNIGKSVMHEILAAMLLSFGVLFLGVAGVIHQMRESRQKPNAPTGAVEEQATARRQGGNIAAPRLPQHRSTL